ncbi:MAG: hypothetical protein R3F49_16525 [Planctomycetota bacterium]
MTCARRPCLVLCVGMLAAPARAQILVENAGVGSPEVPTYEQSFAALDSAHLREVAWTHQFTWAPTLVDELKVVLPLLSREVEFAARRDEALGLGDVRVRYKRQLWRSEGVLASTRFGAVAELLAPTGADDLEAGGVRWPRALQPGGGAFGLGLGLAYTRIRDRHRFASECMLRARAEDEGFDAGESVSLGLSYWYRLAPAVFQPGPHVTEWRGVLECLATWRTEASQDDVGLGDDGALVWFVPGLQVYARRDLLLQASVAVPIVAGVDDPLGDRNWAALLSVRYYL